MAEPKPDLPEPLPTGTYYIENSSTHTSITREGADSIVTSPYSGLDTQKVRRALDSNGL